jgi:hypothetical protein
MSTSSLSAVKKELATMGYDCSDLSEGQIKVIKLVVRLRNKDESADVYPDYSGRFMYGSRCMGVVVSRFEKISLKLGGQSSDSLGLDRIVYWTTVPALKRISA